MTAEYPPYPVGDPPDGWRWSLSWRYVPEAKRIIVTPAMVHHATVYGRRMLTPGQELIERSVRHEAYWALVRI